MTDPRGDPAARPRTDRQRGWSPSLGLRVLALAVFGLALPLAGAGIWLVRSTVASGEAFLQERLERSLGEAVRTMGQRWVGARSRLLNLAEDPEGGWARAEGVAARARVLDLEGRLVGELERGDGDGAGGSSAARRPALPMRLPLRDPADGSVTGALEVEVPLEVLLPGELWWPGVAGSLLALLDPEDGSALVPLPVEAELLTGDRFTWGGTEWAVVRHRLFDPPVVLALAAPVDPITVPLLRSARRGAGFLAVVLLAGLVLVLLSLRRITRPLHSLAAASDAVAGGNLAWKVEEEGPDELRRLARAFNAMTANLRATLRRLSRQESVAAVGEFAATLAHEIRNPLSSVRLDLERIRRRTTDPGSLDLLERIVGEVERLDTTVRGALGVARSGASKLEPVALIKPIEASFHAARPAFRDRGATLEPLRWEGWGEGRDDSDRLTVMGNASALEQLFLNLLLNAADAAGERGRAGVVVRSGAAGEDGPAGEGGPAAVQGAAGKEGAAGATGPIRVTVWDDGPGIPEELRERVFEPFFSTRSDGTGLGLAVGRRIARAHGGELRVGDRAGGGTELHLDLPAKPGR